MRVSLVTVLSGLTAFALAEAIPAPQPGKVRYYFPREVKRQVLAVNTTDSTTSSDGGLADALSDLLNPSSTTTGASPTSTTSNANDDSDSSTTTSAIRLSIGLTTVLSSNQPATTTTAMSTEADSGSKTTSDSFSPTPQNPTPTDASTSTTQGLLPSIVSNLLTTSEASAAPTTTADQSIVTPPAAVTTQPTTTGGLIGSLTSDLLPSPSSSQDIITPPALTTPSSVISFPGTGVSTTSVVDQVPTTTATFDGPTNPGTTTPPYPGTTTPYTSIPVVTPPTTTPLPYTTSAAPDTSALENTPSPVTSSSPTWTGSASLTSSPSPALAPSSSSSSSPETTQALVSSTEATTPPQTIEPTATNTLKSLSQESTIVSASSTKPTAGAPSTSASTIPSSLPRIIQPNGGVPDAPSNGTLIQLGFTYGLNYPFVVSNSWAVQQIFDYLPPGIAYGIKIPGDEVVMQYLQPYNTLSRNGYITTLAMAYIPDDKVNPLSLALLNPKSALYNDDNPTVRTLMGMLDPSIPLLAGSAIGDGSPINSANTATTTNDGKNEGAAGTDDSSGDSSVKPSSIGIGLGVVGGAAVYGVAMFMVAKRYKKRRNAHKRASSVHSAGSGASGGSGPRETNTLMTGGRNSYGSRQPGYNNAGRDSRNSDRSQQSGRTYISPPVMAENSLGWN